MTNSPHAQEVEIIEIADSAGHAGRRVRIESPSADPLNHFHLDANPFMDSVNPELFFRTESHEETFVLMRRAVEDHASLALCTAQSGTGKTLLTQILLQEFDTPRHHAILILAYPSMSRTAVLREVVNELGIEVPGKRASVHRLLAAIQDEIMRLHSEGRRLVLIIDEVHFLSLDSLHILRTLSNIEVPERKLISVLLFGEETFRERLERRSARALLNRMFIRTSLRPLSAQEVEQYIKFRCLMAGGDPGLFADSAHGPIADATGGVPREINRLAHNALLVAAQRGQSSIDGALIEEMVSTRS